MPTSALQASLDTLRLWLIIWTAVVALGLVIEYALPVRYFLVAGYRKLFKNKTPEKRLFSTVVVGGLLITSGVVGEMWVEVLSSRIETDLSTANALEIAALNERAASAGLDAESAKTTARGFELAIAEANSRAAEATARVKEAEAQIVAANAASRDAVIQIALAQARMAAAQAGAAEARAGAGKDPMERAGLPSAASRQLTAEHLATLMVAAKKFGGRTVAIAATADAEAAALAGEIAFALRAAGLTTKTARLSDGSLPFGIVVGGPASEHDLIDGLRRILNDESGLFVASEALPSGTTGDMAVITVGRWPAASAPGVGTSAR